MGSFRRTTKNIRQPGRALALAAFLLLSSRPAEAQFLRTLSIPIRADATVSSLDSSVNYGRIPELLALAWTANEREFVLRSLLQFDLPVLAEGEELLEATLSLYASTGSIHPSHLGLNEGLLLRIVEPWNPDEVTWENQPAAHTSGAVFLPRASDPDQDFIDLDVTLALRAMLDEGPAAQHGLLVQLQSESVFRSLNFASADHPDSTRHPVLSLLISGPVSTALAPAEALAEFQAGPNPLGDVLQLGFQLPHAAELELEVIDASGRLLERQVLGPASAGSHKFSLAAGHWPSGLLHIRLWDRAARQLIGYRQLARH
jgi:hypothetical protein